MNIIIGRGHSGTRIISKVLHDSNFVTGTINDSYDMIPPEEMYCAAKVYGEKVKLVGNYSWKFPSGKPGVMFQKLVKLYLRNLLNKKADKYFKLPETTLCFPWIVSMFPNAHYIHWIRDPRDFGEHLSDNFARWLIPYKPKMISSWFRFVKSDKRIRAAISCKYQWDIVNSCRPKNLIRIRYEDYCLNQNIELDRLQNFLGKTLKPVDVNTDSVGRWKSDPEHFDFDFLKEVIAGGGYETNTYGT